jgi:hypothetical protein
MLIGSDGRHLAPFHRARPLQEECRAAALLDHCSGGGSKGALFRSARIELRSRELPKRGALMLRSRP